MLCPPVVKELNLNDNCLRVLGASIEHLNKLKRLRAERNGLERVELARLPRLMLLSLAENALTALPETLPAAHLVHLDLSGNLALGRALLERLAASSGNVSWAWG